MPNVNDLQMLIRQEWKAELYSIEDSNTMQRERKMNMKEEPNAQEKRKRHLGIIKRVE